MRQLKVFFVLMLFVIGFGLAPHRAAAQTPAPTPSPTSPVEYLCRDGNLLLKNKYITEARTRFNAALPSTGAIGGMAPPEMPECAVTGMTQVMAILDQIEIETSIAKSYEAAGLTKEAREEYLKILALDPRHRQGLEGLKRTLPKGEEIYAPVFALEKAGLLDEAEAKLEEIVQTYPGLEVPVELSYMRPGFGWGVWLALRKTGMLFRPIGAMLLWLAIAFGAVLIVRNRVYPWWRDSRIPRLDIQDFDAGPGDLKSGKALPGLLRERYREVESQAGGRRIDLVAGSIADYEVPEFMDVFGLRVKWVAQLLAWAVPPRVMTLTGSCQTSAQRGAGLTLSLSTINSKSLAEVITLWQETHAPAILTGNSEYDAYVDLVEPAAVWLLYAANAQLD